MIASNLLTVEDWQLFEKINDLFTNYKDINDQFQKALEIILGRMGYPAGAIYFFDDNQGFHDIWARQGIPSELADQMENPCSALHVMIGEIVSDGNTRLNLFELGLAAVFPLKSSCGKVLGVFIVCGHAIPVEQLDLWQAYFRPLNRLLEIQTAVSSQFALERFAPALLSISDKQSSATNIFQFQETALNWLCSLLQTEDALLLLRSDSNPALTVGYLLSRSSEWTEQRGFVLEDSFLDSKMNELEVIVIDFCSNSALMRWIDPAYAGRKVSHVICSMLKENDNVLGAILLINPATAFMSTIQGEFLKLVGNNLLRTILDGREMARIKTSLGDMEANRWEIINSRNTLRRMFDSLPLSVYIVDRSYVLRAINVKRAERIGMQARDLVGRKCYKMLFHRDTPCPQCRIMESFESWVRTRRSSRESNNKDQFTEWDIYTHPVQTLDPLPLQVILVEEDVTEKRILENNLIQSEKLAAVGHLAAGVAHEINNPLAAIIANAQILKREIPKANVDWHESLSLIEMAGDRAAQVVSNLLEIAHKDQQNDFESISINETIESALLLVHHEITSRSIDVILELQQGMPDMMASKNQLQGVWINLLVNCFDAIDKPKGVIHISTSYADNLFRIVVIDNGKGISEEHLKRIFTPFFTTKMVGKGTGLGLSLSLRAIKDYNGNIQVESLVGEGTKITVTLQDMSR